MVLWFFFCEVFVVIVTIGIFINVGSRIAGLKFGMLMVKTALY